MRDGHRQIERGLAVGREKEPVFSGMAVEFQDYVEGCLDLRNRAADRHNRAIGRCAGDGEAVGLGEADYGLVVLI